MRVSIDGGKTWLDVVADEVIIQDIEHYNRMDVFRVVLNDEGVMVTKTEGTKTESDGVFEEYNRLMNNLA